MYRVAPYTNKKNGGVDNRPNLTFWWGKQSSVHPYKADQINADAAFCAVRYLGVLDGVGGVSLLGMHPVAMALELGAKIPEEFEKRLSLGASGYDKETYARLKSFVLPNVPGGLAVMVCQMLTHIAICSPTELYAHPLSYMLTHRAICSPTELYAHLQSYLIYKAVCLSSI